MRTIIVLYAENSALNRKLIRFASENAPAFLVGDTFQVPLPHHNFASATVEDRHWQGKDLAVFCKISDFLFDSLTKKAIEIGCPAIETWPQQGGTPYKFYLNGGYEFPDQDWS